MIERVMHDFYKNQTAKKYWEIETQGPEQLIRTSKLSPWGRDSKYTCKYKVFPSEKEADADSQKEIGKILEKGFTAFAPPAVAPVPTSIDLFFSGANDVFMARAMLDSGVDLSANDVASFASGGSTDVLVELHARGVEIPASVLHGAALTGKTNIVELALDWGIEIDLPDSNGMTALALAAQKQKDKTVAYLISKGADVNAKDRRGVTVLMHATVEAADGVVAQLLEKGAETHATDESGRTALQVAVKWGLEAKPQRRPAFAALCRQLLEAGVPLDEALTPALQELDVTS